LEPTVFAAVLAAAALHAGWNAVVKIGLDRFLALALIVLASGAVALAALPFVAFPHAGAWPFLLASVALHVGYNLSLVQAYGTGGLAQTYPIARGTAPLLVALGAALWLGEPLSVPAMAAVFMVVGGVWLMALPHARDLVRLERRALGFAMLTAVFIAAYTLVDGIGARRAGSAHGYALWLFALDGVVMLILCLLARGRVGLGHMLHVLPSGVAGGAMSLAAYWIVIWAMTRAPLASVAALRETSVLFALVIATAVLREPPAPMRLLAALLIVAGAVAVRLG
jgi:drug/metabolite transporter (DMT)-like permease